MASRSKLMIIINNDNYNLHSAQIQSSIMKFYLKTTVLLIGCHSLQICSNQRKSTDLVEFRHYYGSLALLLRRSVLWENVVEQQT